MTDEAGKRRNDPGPEQRPPLDDKPPRDDRDPATLFAPHLRDEFEQLRRRESEIVERLADPSVAARFAADPARTLGEIGVDLPPLIKGRLVGDRRPRPLPSERRFRLPNGQVVTARVRVRFTRGREG